MSPSDILRLQPNPLHKKIQTRNLQSIEWVMEDCRAHLDYIDYLQRTGKGHLYKEGKLKKTGKPEKTPITDLLGAP